VGPSGGMTPAPEGAPAMRYRFGSQVLDLETLELRDGDRPVELEPQALAVLAHLVRNRHRVVPKAELLDEVWGDRFVSDSALTTRIKHCRRAVGDDGQAQAVIRTVHRVGYRFVADAIEEDGHRHGPPITSAAPLARSAVVGRDRDLAELSARLVDHRVVTVTGPAGIGKSTLAALAVEGTGPAAWCELATTSDPAAVPTVVLAALGEGQQSDADALESMLRALQRRSVLLVLDNCEHVVEAAASLVRNVLRRSPGVRILATSRVPLQVPDESLLPLGPLALDDAVTCFAARAVDAGARIDEGDPAVVELCRHLDGIPLALELAAARARTLGPAEMIQLLEHRFRLLADPSGGDDRHRSLERAIRWSWEALGPADRSGLADLSVLVGRFDLGAAAAVTGADDVIEAADGLERLARASLVTTSDDGWGGRRFRLLETIRTFAQEQHPDPVDARRRLVDHVVERVEHIDGVLLQGEALDDGLAAMADLWLNVRAAIGCASAADDRTSLRRIVRAVGPYADLHQAYEILDWCTDAIGGAEQGAGGDALLADVEAIRARMLAHRGQHERARTLADAAHARHESRTTLLSVMWCAYYQGDLDTVLEGASRLVGLSRSERGMDRGFADGFAAVVATVRQVPEITTSAVDPARAAESTLGALDCMVEGFRLCAADPARAAELLEAVVVASLRRDHRLLLGAAASTLTQVALPAQPPAEGMRTLRRTLDAYRQRGMWTLIAADIVMAARLLADAGEREVATRLLGAREASGYRVGLSELHRAVLHEELESADPEAFARLAAEGASWSPPEAADAAIDALYAALARG
jgi:predicted ATPase/DNA-binding winged helix-turn-helix (wHTH) protein